MDINYELDPALPQDEYSPKGIYRLWRRIVSVFGLGPLFYRLDAFEIKDGTAIRTVPRFSRRSM